MLPLNQYSLLHKHSVTILKSLPLCHYFTAIKNAHCISGRTSTVPVCRISAAPQPINQHVTNNAKSHSSEHMLDNQSRSLATIPPQLTTSSSSTPSPLRSLPQNRSPQAPPLPRTLEGAFCSKLAYCVLRRCCIPPPPTYPLACARMSSAAGYVLPPAVLPECVHHHTMRLHATSLPLSWSHIYTGGYLNPNMH